MTELRTLHLTDIHDDWEKYQIVADYIANKKDSEQAVDAVFITGDFIEGDVREKGKTADLVNTTFTPFYNPIAGPVKEKKREMAVFLKEHNIKSDEDLKSLDSSSKKQFITLSKQIEDEHRKACEKVIPEQIEEILKTFTESYQRHAEALSKIEAPIFGTIGNHDLGIGYYILKDSVTFLDKTNKAALPGKSGLEFIVKGEVNTWEVPGFYSFLSPILEKYFIPYLSGISLSEISKEVNELQKKVTDGPNERLEKIKKGEEPQYAEEQLQEMQSTLEHAIEYRKQVLEYNQSERQRLGDKNEVDIYLTHKLPSCKKARSDIKGSLSDITLDYAANANAVYGGHFHDGQIGCRTIEDFLKQESTETTTIDGVEVPVFYLDEKEPWELNPGTKYFFVTEYDTNKQVEQVIQHEFYYQEAA